MKIKINYRHLLESLTALLITTGIFVGCGSDTSKENIGTISDAEIIENNEKGSNIPYLKENHLSYRDYQTSEIPKPIKNANNKSIEWRIIASSKEGAIELVGHIQFMGKKLLTGNNPRAWDKLFLMDAYMKTNEEYTTEVGRSGFDVIITKQANSACAYEVLSAHSDAVSGDFFARADLSLDYSLIAEAILASSTCDYERHDIKNYIIDRQVTRG